RKAGPEDAERYQTVYSSQTGAVAAPTAGLHFTPQLLSELSQLGFRTEQLTLHVGAGTFQPIKENDLSRHPMHREQLVISEENLRHLLNHNGPLISVGTTSMRTLESLYWYGTKLLLKDPQAPFFISKDECYQYPAAHLPTGRQSLAAVFSKIQQLPEHTLRGETEIFIVPGYQFKLCNGLITNFHQPESTLMLLVAAFIGPDWKQVYQQALEQNYRFLSYGDSSLLLPSVLSKMTANT
ncbi:MAG: S-adenosylmethionine:tRNA ribosyltransferase-isomerase, partial [Bacteroidetes bacterium]|nr:S-adenosylmethionine:tRNA ribosyltransferase-isomerase [Bacteroidota bacterium]